MRILFLTSRFPFPPIGGDKLRVFYFLQYLSKHHDVDLFSLVSTSDEPDELEPYRHLVRRVETVHLSKTTSYINCLLGLLRGGPLQNHYFHSGEAKRAIDSLVAENDYDLLFVHLIRMADYVKGIQGVKKVIDLTDALSLNYERARPYQKGLFSLINNIEHGRVRRYEADIMQYFDRGYLVSRFDRDFMSSHCDVERIDVIPNGVNLDYFTFQPNDRPSNRIIFLGNLRTFPNTDAAVYFARDIFPRVRELIPDAEFTILGQEPSERIKQLGSQPGISVTDAVPDVRPYLSGASISVCPLRAGAGVQNKILESMAIGTPVVTTSIGLEGIEAEAGCDLLVADDPNSFADSVVSLMKDHGMRKKLSENARRLIENHYGWEENLSSLNGSLEAMKSRRESDAGISHRSG